VDSVNDGTYVLKPGNVTVSDLTAFYPPDGDWSEGIPIYAQETIAHLYGDASVSLYNISYTDKNVSDVNYADWIEGDDWFAHYFTEGIGSDSNALFYTTDRYINVTYSSKYYNVTSGGNGTTNNITYINSEGKEENFYVAHEGQGGSTYINGTAGAAGCGPRCATTMVFQASSYQGEGPQEGYLFEVNVTISNTTNAVNGQPHELPDDMALLAAQAACLQGFNDYSGFMSNLYMEGVTMGILMGPDADAMGKQVARFAVGTIANMDKNNPNVDAYGKIPMQGNKLDVHWARFSGLLIALAAAQLLMAISAVIYASSVIVKDDSHLTTARLLRRKSTLLFNLHKHIGMRLKLTTNSQPSLNASVPLAASSMPKIPPERLHDQLSTVCARMEIDIIWIWAITLPL
jgi:hypothetical protein